MTDLLERIFKARSIAASREERAEPYAELRDRAMDRKRERRSFLRALHDAAAPAIIGEIKRASPSAGLIARNFDPAAIAQSYSRAGIDCISVLTESDHFLGELAFLDVARSNSRCPILRKDFLSTPYQVAQSSAYGADAVLLIAASLTDESLRDCLREAAEYDLDVVLEVHDRGQLERALALGPRIVGVNNRDLRTFEIDLGVSDYLLPKVPAGVTAISESGVRDRADLVRLHEAGAHGFLIGESLMRCDDPGALVRSFKSALHAPV